MFREGNDSAGEYRCTRASESARPAVGTAARTGARAVVRGKCGHQIGKGLSSLSLPGEGAEGPA